MYLKLLISLLTQNEPASKVFLVSFNFTLTFCGFVMMTGQNKTPYNERKKNMCAPNKLKILIAGLSVNVSVSLLCPFW